MNDETHKERRHFHRVLFDARANLQLDDKDHLTKLVDISLNGALVKRPESWGGKVGDDVTLSIPLDEKQVITMRTMVTHMIGEYLGLRCHHIDMDSITHLRRLVELNLADAHLLERDLEALG